MNRFFITAFTFLSIIFAVKATNLEETATKILKNSPSYRSQILSLQRYKAETEGGVNLSDPTLSGEFLAAPGDETDRWAAELTWELEWPGVYNARKKAGKKLLSQKEKAAAAELVEGLTEIKILLLDYILKVKQLEILDLRRATNDSVLHHSNLAAQKGEITLLDLNKLKLENTNLKLEKALLTDNMMSTVESLSQILGSNCRPYLDEMQAEFPAMQNYSALIDNYSDNLPLEILAYELEVEAAKAQEKVVKMESLPAISFGYKHAFEDGLHFNGGTLGLSIPIFSNRHHAEEARAATAEAEFKLESAKENVITQVNLLIKKLDLMQDQVKEIGDILNSTDYNSLLLKAYENGTLTLINYLLERDYFSLTTLQFLELQYSASVMSVKLAKYFNYPEIF